jgi:hypothetical protein
LKNCLPLILRLAFADAMHGVLARESNINGTLFHDSGEGMRRAPIAIAVAIRTWIPVVMAKAPTPAGIPA